MMAIVKEPVETVEIFSPSGSLATVDARTVEQYLASGWTPAAGYSDAPAPTPDKTKKTK